MSIRPLGRSCFGAELGRPVRHEFTVQLRTLCRNDRPLCRAADTAIPRTSRPRHSARGIYRRRWACWVTSPVRPPSKPFSTCTVAVQRSPEETLRRPRPSRGFGRTKPLEVQKSERTALRRSVRDRDRSWRRIRALSCAFAGLEGARIVVADYGVDLDGTGSSPEPAEQVAKEIQAAGGEAVSCFASVAERDGAASIVQTALEAFGGVDVLVNNAGIADPDWFEDTDMDRLETMTRYQYHGTAYMCKEAWPYLKAAEHGCIVNTASEAVTGFVPKCASYSGAKGAVYSLTRALALDGQRFGLRVNAICPRGNTRMNAPEVMSYFYDQPPETFQGAFDQMRNEHVSPAVAYLAHDSCPLTGETFICGGLSVMRLTFIQTAGITTSETITPEDIAENLDAIMDPTDAAVRTIENPPR